MTAQPASLICKHVVPGAHTSPVRNQVEALPDPARYSLERTGPNLLVVHDCNAKVSAIMHHTLSAMDIHAEPFTKCLKIINE